MIPKTIPIGRAAGCGGWRGGLLSFATQPAGKSQRLHLPHSIVCSSSASRLQRIRGIRGLMSTSASGPEPGSYPPPPVSTGTGKGEGGGGGVGGGGSGGVEPSSSSAMSASNDEVARLASLPLPPCTLNDLVCYGFPPLSAPNLLSSARYTRNILPIRLAKRILALRNLPFIIVSNPHISEIYSNYIYSLQTIQSFPFNAPTTLAEEEKFTELLSEIVKTHANTIPTLAKGFIECRKYITPDEVGQFLDRHLRARIGTRLMAEQHIALHNASIKREGHEPHTSGYHHEQDSGRSYIGTIDTEMLPATIIKSCATFVGDICEMRYGVRPRLIIEGHTKERFPYIPVHLEYMVTELLKNAYRSTIETNTGAAARAREAAAGIADAATTSYDAPSDSESDDESDGEDSEEEDEASRGLPPVIVTLAMSTRPIPPDPPAPQQVDPFAAGDSTRAAEGVRVRLSPVERLLTIRIRDRGGGIPPEVQPNIWKYSFTTFDPERGRYPTSPAPVISASDNPAGILDHVTGPANTNMDALNITAGISAGGGPAGSSIAGLGYGLPLSRAYAEYFGGSLRVQSCYGWGTDVYLTLKGVAVDSV